MNTIQDSTQNEQTHFADEWFDDIIESIRIDQLALQTNTASDEKKDFYEKAIAGNPEEFMLGFRSKSAQHFISTLVVDFVNELLRRETRFTKLAFDYNQAKVLVWVEINDDDETSEDNLILSEAYINAKYAKKGFNLTLTILEKSDCLPVPAHYKEVKLD